MESSRNRTPSPVVAVQLFLLAWIALFVTVAAKGEYKPAKGPLMTRWAKDVAPDNVHKEYPRPQMVREDWLNLNGLWDYAIQPKDQSQPQSFQGQILVPFAAESALSGVMKPVGEQNRLWYRRTFEIPKAWKGKRILLHFGAVDWDATVWVNGKELGAHRGGYDPFTFDVTEAIKDAGLQELVIRVWDPTDTGTQPRGKQVRKPQGIWYTAVTGIWQTVWLEPVSPAYIKSLRMEPDIDSGKLKLRVEIGGDVSGPQRYDIRAILPKNPPQKLRPVDKPTGFPSGTVSEELVIAIENPKLWSPDSPYLYDLQVMLGKEDARVRDKPGAQIVSYDLVDRVSTYFGMRKISLGKDEKGVTRLFLNNKALFQFGPLDQGWWPDGLYTAPTDEALRYDIEVLKKLGCNMLRKHVKVEPDLLYYWADKLGLMIWQDMPSGDRFIGGKDPDIKRGEESARQFELELKTVIESLYNHPSIIMWVPFNEGWGQYDTPRIVDLIRKLDPTRLVDNASGWSDRGVGDVHDVHSYPGPAAPPVEEKRAAVLGEFGGLGLPIKSHTWQDEKNWGYRTFKTREELTNAYLALIDNLRSLIDGGLCAGVYTQTTDVEVEVNGLMTYDRAMIKMDAEKAAAANKRLYLPPPVVKIIVPTSQSEAQQWRYTTTKPAEGWEQPAFDDSTWQQGRGGFGTKGTPGAVVRTEWNTSDIWIRRTFELKSDKFARPHLMIHHDEDSEVYINGQLVTKLDGYTAGYVRAALDQKATAALKLGPNYLAVHCRQTAGGQYIDAGVVDVVEQPIK